MAEGVPTYSIPIGGGIQIARIAEGVQDPWPESHFSLPDHWYVHLYNYEAEIFINGRMMRITPGCAGIIPPGAEVRYQRYGPSTHLFALFRCLDETSPAAIIPAVQELGDRLSSLTQRFESAIGFFALEPARAQARLGDILWDLSQPRAEAQAPWGRVDNAIVLRACQFIEQALHRPLTVERIAQEARVCTDHLARLFSRHLNQTVLGHLRQRRAARAEHLLVHSSLPLKTIAAQVGIPDPHLFNKTIRRELGSAPSQVRRRASQG